nr:unnamed protein product [Callosobruchus analis]
MHDQRAPIVVVSEDYLDQRDDPQKILWSEKLATTHTANVNKIQRQATTSKLRVREKSMTIVTKVQCLSRSLIYFCNSPRKSRDNDSNVRRNTSETASESEIEDTTRRNMSDKLNIQNNFEVYDEANYVGPKPSELYCPNRTIEWKRSWTLPVFSPKSQSKEKQTPGDTTYLYDDGTDIDSSFLH